MSSRQADILAQAEFFTTTHRLTGEVQTGPKPLSDLLNDPSLSYVLVYNVYLSGLGTPGVIDAYAPVTYLSKDNLLFVIVTQREARATDHGRFSAQEYDALVTLPGFELKGRFTGPPRIDLRNFSPAALDSFMLLTGAMARFTGAEGEPFRGEAILINRARLESLNLAD